MSEFEKKMVSSYTTMLMGLSNEAKLELINTLSDSIKNETDNKQEAAVSYDDFMSGMTAEEIIEFLRSSRHFREKDLSF